MDKDEPSHPAVKNLPFSIKEDSLFARLASYKLHSPRMAITLGRTIHLYNCTAAEFLANEKWVRHEMEHIKQFQKHGFFRFVILYLLESIRNGYYYNRFEVEARKSEQQEKG